MILYPGPPCTDVNNRTTTTTTVRKGNGHYYVTSHIPNANVRQSRIVKKVSYKNIYSFFFCFFLESVHEVKYNQHTNCFHVSSDDMKFYATGQIVRIKTFLCVSEANHFV